MPRWAKRVSPAPSGALTMWYTTWPNTSRQKDPSLCHSGPTLLKPRLGSLERRNTSRHGDSGCTPCVEWRAPAPKDSESWHCCSPVRKRPETPDSSTWRPCPRRSTRPWAAINTSSAPATLGSSVPLFAGTSRPIISMPHGLMGVHMAPCSRSTVSAASAVAPAGYTAVRPRPGRCCLASRSACCLAMLMRSISASWVDIWGGGSKPTRSKSRLASSSERTPVGVRSIVLDRPLAGC
mmetsp:Transcript_1627/g.5284  ORF Transcript_1627/g.5284 Transcript_1627/m.5284 type:complete len:237 (+) Transcript_1627:607-1317(+)